MDKPFVPVFLGSGREGRYSEKVARAVFEVVEQLGTCDTQFLDVRDCVTSNFTIAPWMKTPETKRWQELMQRADGLLIIIPEYNHGYPGEMKLVLDQADKEYRLKPVGIVGVSEGSLGGARVVEVLHTVFQTFQMITVPKPIYVANVQADDFSIEAYAERFKRLAENMVKYAVEFKGVRERLL